MVNSNDFAKAMLNHMPAAKRVLGSMRKSKDSQITQNIQILRQIFSNDVAMRKWVIVCC